MSTGIHWSSNPLSCCSITYLVSHLAIVIHSVFSVQPCVLHNVRMEESVFGQMCVDVHQDTLELDVKLVTAVRLLSELVISDRCP